VLPTSSSPALIRPPPPVLVTASIYGQAADWEGPSYADAYAVSTINTLHDAW
jgi:hypothetical protein